MREPSLCTHTPDKNKVLFSENVKSTALVPTTDAFREPHGVKMLFEMMLGQLIVAVVPQWLALAALSMLRAASTTATAMPLRGILLDEPLRRMNNTRIQVKQMPRAAR